MATGSPDLKAKFDSRTSVLLKTLIKCHRARYQAQLMRLTNHVYLQTVMSGNKKTRHAVLSTRARQQSCLCSMGAMHQSLSHTISQPVGATPSSPTGFPTELSWVCGGGSGAYLLVCRPFCSVDSGSSEASRRRPDATDVQPCIATRRGDGRSAGIARESLALAHCVSSGGGQCYSRSSLRSVSNCCHCHCN
ncbi:hypothetical protein BC567DRAFT_218483 [Phyllosticta citribraziliensis]